MPALMHRKLRIVPLLAVCLCALLGAARTDGDSAREYDIKAAYLYHFVQYVQLPPRPDESTITIGLLGGDPSGGAFSMINGKILDGKRLVVKELGAHWDPHTINIVFVSDAERDHWKQIFDAAQSAGVLTVGETSGFDRSGGIINFFDQDNRVRFEINPNAAARQNIKISSQLLRLAKIVHG